MADSPTSAPAPVVPLPKNFDQNNQFAPPPAAQKSPLDALFQGQNQQLQNLRSHEVRRDIGGRVVDENTPTGLDWLQANGPQNQAHHDQSLSRYEQLGRETQTEMPTADLLQAQHPGMNFGHPSSSFGISNQYGTGSVNHDLSLSPATITSEQGQTSPMADWFATHPDTSGISTKDSGQMGIGNMNGTSPEAHAINTQQMLSLPRHGAEIGAKFATPTSIHDQVQQAIKAPQSQADQAAITSVNSIIPSHFDPRVTRPPVQEQNPTVLPPVVSQNTQQAGPPAPQAQMTPGQTGPPKMSDEDWRKISPMADKSPAPVVQHGHKSGQYHDWRDSIGYKIQQYLKEFADRPFN